MEERHPSSVTVHLWPDLGRPCFPLPPVAAPAAVVEDNSRVVSVRWDRRRVVAWSTFHSTRPVHAAVAVGGFGMLLVERRSGGRHWLVEREERAPVIG